MSEMKKPEDYPKALFLLQGSNTTLYAISAAVIYRFGGRGVSSPALGSTGPTLGKVAYGVALPTVSRRRTDLPAERCVKDKRQQPLTNENQIIIAGVINGHVACKYVYVRSFRGTGFMAQRTWRSIGAWIFLAFVGWLIGWIIAEAIPVFNNLLNLIVRPSDLFSLPLAVYIYIYMTDEAWRRLTFNTLLFQTALFASWFTCK